MRQHDKLKGFLKTDISCEFISNNEVKLSYQVVIQWPEREWKIDCEIVTK